MYSCASCGVNFQSSRGLSWHMDSAHKGIRYPCNLCGKEFMQKNNLDNHVRRHMNERPFKCDQCTKSYVSKKDLTRHLISHKGEAGKRYKCNLCSKMFADGSLLKTHINRHLGVKNYPCKECNYRAGNISHLKRHELIHKDERPHSCTKCSYRFRTRSDLKRHFRTHLKELLDATAIKSCISSGSSVAGGNNHRCQFCKNQFQNEADLNNHIAEHYGEKRFACKKCGKKFWALSMLKRHEIKHTNWRPFPCSVCSRNFRTLEHLKRHTQQIHTNQSADYECRHCNKKFKSKECLRIHSRRVHPVILGVASHLRHGCLFCEKRFFTNTQLVSHMLVHTRERPHHCKLCKREFGNLSTLYLHISQKHTLERPFSCGHCEYRAVNRRIIKMHQLRCQKRINIQNCKTCKKLANTNQSLIEHMQKMHGYPLLKRNFKCVKCGKEFIEKGELVCHLRSHERQNKMQRCLFCNDTRVFRKEQCFMAHIWKHTGEKPYFCEYCSYETLFKNQLIVHVLRVHKSLGQND